MRKLFIIFLFFLSTVAVAQKKDSLHSDTLLIGYIAPTSDVFLDGVLLIADLGNEIINYCTEDGLILFRVNEEWKDVHELMNKIEKKLGGACFLKQGTTGFYQGRCKDRLLKERLKNKN